MNLGLEVIAALGTGAPTGSTRAPASTAIEETAEEVIDVGGAVGEVTGTSTTGMATESAPRKAAHGPGPTDLVVFRPTLVVTDYVVGGGHILEPLLR